MLSKSSLNSVIDIFLPRFCPACQKKLAADVEVICPECLSSIRPPDPVKLASEFSRKFSKDNIITDFITPFLFEEGKALQKLIHSIKYGGRYQNAYYLGWLAGEKLKDKVLCWKPQMIVPVPLHPVKKAERGYNQSYYIAKGFSRVTGIPLRDDVLKRTRFTDSQTALTVPERRANMKGAFGLRKRADVTGKVIIVLDDVITSGSTVNECGRVLLNKGALKIYAVSAALAL